MICYCMDKRCDVKKAGLIVNKKKDQDLLITSKIVSTFIKNGFKIFMDEKDSEQALDDHVIFLEFLFLGKL